MFIFVGDRILLKSFPIYPGDPMPDIDPSQYTGEIIASWGYTDHFYKVRRDVDGKVYPIMDKDIQQVIERKRTKKVWGR